MIVPPGTRRGAMPLPALVAVVLAACVPAGAPPATPAELTPAREWRFVVADHVALWYHGLAHSGTPEADAARALPIYDATYVPRADSARRAHELPATPLEERAAEFAATFRRADSYRQLETLPLYFTDGESLRGAVELWNRVGGDPRRAGSFEAANVVALLSGLFPQSPQREVLDAWSRLLTAERHAFFDAHWAGQRPRLDTLAALAAAEWAALAGPLRPLLAYLGSEGGDAYLVPALGGEGRMLLRGAGHPRVAIGVPAVAAAAPEDAGEGRSRSGADAAAQHAAAATARSGAAESGAGAQPGTAGRDVVYRFIRELVTPLAAETVREYLAPARVRQLGAEALEQRAAVRAAALALDAVSAAHGDAFRRAYIELAGGRPPDGGVAALEIAFRQAFPLPTEVERGLAGVMRTALAGI